MISIGLENLTKRFDSFVAVDHVDLRIHKGELFFLLGPSGCGKTTLLRMISGFQFPDEGQIRFDDQVVTTLPPHQRNIAMMFQNYALWPHLTVLGNIKFGLQEKRIPKSEINQRTESILKLVHLQELAQRRIGELSGGQQQRVALARALVVNPRALLLDEPLSNLDAQLRLEMRSEIRRICKESGLTAIYVTHDQKEALSMADRLAVMDKGRIIQIGTPEEVYRSPHSTTVANFIGETNFLSGTIRGLSPSSISVDTSVGSFEGLKSNPNWTPKEHDAVVLSVRPECWSIQNDLKTINCVRGRIEETSYLGEVAQHVIRKGEITLKLFELNPRPSERKSDQDVFAHVRPEDVMVLPKKD